MANDKVSRKMRIVKKLLLAIVLLLIIALVKEVEQTVEVEGTLELVMFDVGQADCFYVRQGDYSILIDCATSGQISGVLKRLKELGVEKLDFLILTHPHSDHMGGTAVVINEYGQNIGTIFMPDYTQSIVTTAWQTNMQEAFLRRSGLEQEYLKEYSMWEKECDALSSNKQARYISKKTDEFFVKNGCIVHPKVGDKLQFGEATIEFIAPNSEKYTNLNNYSIAFQLVFGDVSILFTGDAEVLSEKEMLQTGINLDSDILKIGHHGSNTSSSEEFLDAVSPKAVMISCKLGHDDENPDAEVVKRLEAKGYEVYRTDENGEVSMTTDGKQIFWSCKPGDYLSGVELAEKEASK